MLGTLHFNKSDYLDWLERKIMYHTLLQGGTSRIHNLVKMAMSDKRSDIYPVYINMDKKIIESLKILSRANILTVASQGWNTSSEHKVLEPSYLNIS